MSYLDVANSDLMFALCGAVIAFVLVQAALFARLAWKRGVRLGVGRSIMKEAMTNAAIFSVIPSLPIVVMLTVLTVNLGRYFPWLRLSVVGSATYENMAADIVAKASGLKGISDPGFSLPIFTTAMWVMTIGIIWGIVFNIFFMRSLDRFSKRAREKKNKFIPIFSSALFIGMLALMSAPYVTDFKNLTSIASFAAAAVAALVCGVAAKKTGVKALEDFSLPISLIMGMASAIAFTRLAL